MKDYYPSAIGKFLSCAFVVCLPLHAQSTQSSILGSVTDTTGAAMANAAVTIRNEGTNFVRNLRPMPMAAIASRVWKPVSMQ